MASKLKVCAYCRVSTDSKDQENSFENQKSYFNRVLQNNKDCILTGIYPDQGLTGTKLNNRPEFNKMLYDAGIDISEHFTGKDRRLNKKHILFDISNRKPLFNEIWIKNTSRFARNTLSFEIIDALRNKGVHIRFIEQNINTKDIGSDFLLKLFQLFDEQESKDKSSKTIFGIKEGARKGVISTNNNIYGYNYIKEENRLEIIPEEAEIVKKIFELYSQGLGARRIINELKKEGIKTRRGKDFVKNTIINIIKNEKYIGLNVRMKYDTGIVILNKHYPKLRDKKEWIINKTEKIPPIINEELFYKCQDIRENKVNTIQQLGVYKGISEYAGLIKCGNCGNNYTSNKDKDRYFYNCSNKKQHGISACDNPNVSKKIINDEIDNLVNGGYKKGIDVNKKFSVYLLNKLKDKLSTRIDLDVSNIVDEKNNELEKLYVGQERILDLYQNMEIDKDTYLKRISDLKVKIEALEVEINKLNKSNNEIYKDITSIDNTIEDIKNIEFKESYTRDNIIESILYIEVKNDNGKPKLDFTFKYFKTYFEMIKKYKDLL